MLAQFDKIKLYEFPLDQTGQVKLNIRGKETTK